MSYTYDYAFTGGVGPSATGMFGSFTSTGASGNTGGLTSFYINPNTTTNLILPPGTFTGPLGFTDNQFQYTSTGSFFSTAGTALTGTAELSAFFNACASPVVAPQQPYYVIYYSSGAGFGPKIYANGTSATISSTFIHLLLLLQLFVLQKILKFFVNLILEKNNIP